jgi:endonuclease/exonuclease/phosphatase family metal-dependent hydrolase
MTRVRIATFNVENLTDVAGAAIPLAARAEVLRPQLARLDADVVCLQEVDARRIAAGDARTLTALAALLDGTGYEDFHRASTVNRTTGGPRDRHNLVVLSRWPIGRIAQYENDLVEAPRHTLASAGQPAGAASPVPWDRPILHAEIVLPGGPSLHVLNAHLRAPLASFIEGRKSGPFSWDSVGGWAEGYFLAAIKRSGQALEARLVIEKIFDSDPAALIALAGDFNAEEREVPLRILLADVEDTGNGRLAGRSLVLIEHSLPASQRFTVIHRGRRLMLDHLLVSRPLMAHYRAIEVHNEMLGDELVAYTLVDAAPDSYHAPVVGEFEIA